MMELFNLRKMGERNDEGRNRAMEDLLKRFTESDVKESEYGNPNKEESEEIELNLGLSLGGRFGIDKNPKKLIRSSSVAGTLPVVRDDEGIDVRHFCYPNLVRASSLPTETEEEWRKRKEMQTLRRMEAKRRRLEKQRLSKEEKDLEDDRREIESSFRIGSSVVPAVGLPNWAVAARGMVIGGDGAGKGFVQPSSQGSVESQGGSSSGISELESRPVQGSSNYGEARSPASNQSLHEQRNQDVAGSSGTKPNEIRCQTSNSEMDTTSKKPPPPSAKNKGREVGTNAMEDMPCVFTKGTGPNGRRVDGVLYKYGKGEEVRIMCVCHGSFLSPAEFVKHAGGGDVAHPLKHIVVNPCPSSFL